MTFLKSVLMVFCVLPAVALAHASDGKIWELELMNGDDRMMFDLLEGFDEYSYWDGDESVVERRFGNETGRFKIICEQRHMGGLEMDSACTLYVVDKKIEGEKDLETTFHGSDLILKYKNPEKTLQWMVNMMGDEVHSFEIIRREYRFETFCSAASRECTWKIRFNEE